ncbi:MAG: acylphosphatase [Gemmatimonadaceae bacterium]|nr:acylphosphatase [Gemmatimonadaceae bacterium]
MTEEVRRLIVRGKVQGVGFRWFVADEARRLGLSGWVRNNRDGTVELCALGSPDRLRALEALVTKGPSGAHVSNVERVEGKAAGKLESPFSIARD